MEIPIPQMLRPDTDHPAPFIVFPASGNHKQTFIVLHGRGSNGKAFGPFLLMTDIPDFGDLQTAFPDAKFVFPTASARKTMTLNDYPTNQFFDIWSLRDPDAMDEIQFEGLREESASIHGLLRHAISEVGADNVVLWGLSQGCAIALISLFLWDGPAFAAAIGMCGWLPLRKRMLERLAAVSNSISGDGMAHQVDDAASSRVRLMNAVSCVRETLDVLPATGEIQAACPPVPIFLGHGILDDKVAVDLGRQAQSLLISLGLDVQWQEYQRLSHWYSGEMLRDIIVFVRRRMSSGELEDDKASTSKAL